jgi:hypothetical protein
MRLARSDVVASSVAMTANVVGSHGLTPKRSFRRKLVASAATNKTRCNANAGQPCGLSQDHLAYHAGLRSQGNADADFARPLAHRVRDEDENRKFYVGHISDILKHVVEQVLFLRRHSSGRAALRVGKAQNAAKDKYC